MLIFLAAVALLLLLAYPALRWFCLAVVCGALLRAFGALRVILRGLARRALRATALLMMLSIPLAIGWSVTEMRYDPAPLPPNSVIDASGKAQLLPYDTRPLPSLSPVPHQRIAPNPSAVDTVLFYVLGFIMIGGFAVFIGISFGIPFPDRRNSRQCRRTDCLYAATPHSHIGVSHITCTPAGSGNTRELVPSRPAPWTPLPTKGASHV